MESGGNAQPLHKQGGVLNVVQVAVGEDDLDGLLGEPLHVGAQGAGAPAGVDEQGLLIPLQQIHILGAVHKVNDPSVLVIFPTGIRGKDVQKVRLHDNSPFSLVAEIDLYQAEFQGLQHCFVL